MSDKPLVVITDFIDNPPAIELDILRDIAEVKALGAHSEEELIGQIEQAAAIMVYHFIELREPMINRLQDCRLIVRCGVGYDNIDARAASVKGIPVANVPDYGTEEVADSAIGMMLSLTRGIHYLDSRLRHVNDLWSYSLVRPVHRLRGQTFGVVGLGRIGTAVALRAKALGIQVVFYDPYKQDGYDKALGVRRAESLRELLQVSQIVSMHCPLTDETRHMINAETIREMPPGSYLVNTARGGVVDAAAALEAITQGHLAGAALDVLEQEPPAEENPLIQAWRDPQHPAFSRLIINPHSAFYSEEGLEDMRIKGSENCRRVLLGESARNVVNGVNAP